MTQRRSGKLSVESRRAGTTSDRADGAADRGSVALVESVAGGVFEGRGRPASDVRFAARAARFKPVPTAALLRPRHDAGIRMSRFAEAPNDRTEVTMKQTQPNARKLTAVPVNGARLRRLRSARIALTG